MHKIPVFATVSRAYGFLLGEIGTILRLVWAPLLGAAAVSYVYGPQVMDAAVRAQSNPSAAVEALPMQLLLGAVSFVAVIMATVALLRVVIFGDRKPGLFVYLWFGAAEFRLIVAYLLLVIAIIAGAIAVGLVFGLLAVLASAMPGGGAIIGVAARNFLGGVAVELDRSCRRCGKQSRRRALLGAHVGQRVAHVRGARFDLFALCDPERDRIGGRLRRRSPFTEPSNAGGEPEGRARRVPTSGASLASNLQCRNS
jgi:hypothetical protein